MAHANARLGPAGRRELILLMIARGMPERRGAACLSGSPCTAHASGELLGDERGVRHIVTPPYTPRWNGKVERFHQTIEREWAKGCATATAPPATGRHHTGYATTTRAGATAHSAATTDQPRSQPHWEDN
jgi:hypothetical protein